jgi:hypothetical protein
LRLLLRGGVDLDAFEPLEQQDFLAAEKKELLMRYLEQSNLVYATAKDHKAATILMERLRLEFFVGYIDRKKTTQDRQTQELLDMQTKTYRITATGSGGILEIVDKGDS